MCGVSILSWNVMVWWINKYILFYSILFYSILFYYILFYMTQRPPYIWWKHLFISSYIRKPFIMYDFAPDPIWISLYMRKILFSLFSEHLSSFSFAHVAGIKFKSRRLFEQSKYFWAKHVFRYPLFIFSKTLYFVRRFFLCFFLYDFLWCWQRPFFIFCRAYSTLSRIIKNL
jgi:hypothetical protein